MVVLGVQREGVRRARRSAAPGPPRQVSGPNGPAQLGLPLAAPRAPECPASSRRSSVPLHGGRKPEGLLLRLAVRSRPKQGLRLRRQHSGRPAAPRGCLLAAFLPLSQPVSQRPLTAPARRVWAGLRDARLGRGLRAGREEEEEEG